MEENLNLFDREVKKASQKKEHFFKFCPVCGSLNVKPVIYGLGKDAAALSPQMKCADCKFYGFILEATPENIAEFRKGLKEKSEEK